jgi:TPR repeat protein
MTKYCPNCKIEVEAGRFCPECGTKLEDIQSELFCPQCGKVYDHGKFCPECGVKLEERKKIQEAPKAIVSSSSSQSSIECPACGYENPAGSTVCAGCGFPLESAVVDNTISSNTAILSEDEAILAKYSDEYGDIRDLNDEEAPLAIEDIRRLVEKGNAQAECFLGYIYVDGKYIEQDNKRAYELICDAERKGYALASAYKGIFYMQGLVVEQDLKEAERLFDTALHIPGVMFLKGMLCMMRDDMTESIKWVKMAAEKGDSAGLCYMGHAYMNGIGNTPQDPIKAFEYYNESAALGNPEAENMLGVCYQNGQGTEPNDEQALSWYQEAAKHNDSDALNNLANCYKNGLLGLEADPEKAFELYKKAAEQDNVDAMFEVAEYYDASYLTAQKSVEWYQKAADAGHGDAMFELARKYENGWNVDKDPSKAQEYYEKAAEAGSERAIHREEEKPLYMNWLDETGQRLQKELTDDVYDIIIDEIRKDAENGVALAQKLFGDFYFDGEVMTQNYPEAIKWYKQAAEQDVYGAQNNLGVCYFNGLGVKKDYSEAVKWYKQSAKHGNAVAQFNLGNCYFSGNGVEQNSTEAIKWYKKAASQGYLLAQEELNKIDKKEVNSSSSTPEIEKAKAALKKNDYKTAISILKKLSNQANPEAQFELAKCYQDGLGVTKNTSVAASWLNKAADLGYVPAYYALGQRNEFGTDITPNQEQAAKWYRKAAEQGHLESQFRLGLMYDEGRGVKQNAKKALDLIKKAADNGLKEAKEYIASLKDKPTAIIKKTWIETDINYSSTRRGLRFHIDFEVHNIMNKEFNCSINFLYDWGRTPGKVLVFNTDPQELSVDGGLVVGESQIAQFNDVICNDWRFEVPYYLLCNHDSKGTWPIIARVIVFGMNGKKATELKTFEKKFSITYSKKLFSDPTYEVVVK